MRSELLEFGTWNLKFVSAASLWHLRAQLAVNNLVQKPFKDCKRSSTAASILDKTLIMKNRDEYLVALRPEIASIRIHDNMSDEERFQNITLRPIAKLQNDLLVAVFRNYIKKHKNVFNNLTADKRVDYIENAVNRDQKFRNSLKGILIGQFTMKEYEIYISNSSALNKRMMNLVRERLISNIQLLEGRAVNL